MLGDKFSLLVLSRSVLILFQITFFISCHFLSNLSVSKQARHKVNPWFIEWIVIHFCCAWFNSCVWLSQWRQQTHTQHVFLTQLDWHGNSRSFFMSGKTFPIAKKLLIRLYTPRKADWRSWKYIQKYVTAMGFEPTTTTGQFGYMVECSFTN